MVLGTARRRPITIIAIVAMIFDLEKRSIVSSTFHTLCRSTLRRTGPSTHGDGPALSLLGLDRLALGANVGNHGPSHLHLHTIGDLDLDVGRVLGHLGHLADDAAGGDDGVAAAHILDHLLVSLHPRSAHPRMGTGRPCLS